MLCIHIYICIILYILHLLIFIKVTNFSETEVSKNILDLIKT